MTPLDTKILPKVLSTIERVGTEATFNVKGQAEYDVAQGVAFEAGVTQVARKVSPPVPYADRLIDGDNIRRGDTQVIVAGSGLTFTPEVNMIVKINGENWTIVSPEPIYSGDAIAAYSLHLRK